MCGKLSLEMGEWVMNDRFPMAAQGPRYLRANKGHPTSVTQCQSATSLPYTRLGNWCRVGSELPAGLPTPVKSKAAIMPAAGAQL